MVISYLSPSMWTQPRCCSTDFRIWKNWFMLDHSSESDLEFSFVNATLMNLDADERSPGRPMPPMPRR